jgi:predicted acylesterase/phospholipase RssA
MAIQARSLRYLAWEGGGAKGLLFPGALMALMEKGVLKYVDAFPGLAHSPVKLAAEPSLRFAGSSAGAMTALLVSCGYSPTEVLLIVEGQDANAFFDINRSLVPTIGGCVPAGSLVNRQQIYPGTGSASSATLRTILTALFTAVAQTRALPPSAVISYFAQLTDLSSVTSIAGMITTLQSSLPRGVVAALNATPQAIDDAVESVLQHFGIFVGCQAREFLNKWLSIGSYRLTQAGAEHWSESMAREREGILREQPRLEEPQVEAQALRKTLIHFSNHYNTAPARLDNVQLQAQSPRDQALKQSLRITFGTHRQKFGVPLYITGSNIETGTTEIFSAFTTTEFFVADAVRISMGLPLIFKPLIIRQPQLAQANLGAHAQLNGVWSDGGYFNNLPLYAFQLERGARRMRMSEILGLRLANVPVGTTPTAIRQFAGPPPDVGYAGHLALNGFMGTGESQVSTALAAAANVVEFDPGGLTTFNFSPSRLTIRAQIDAAQRTLASALESTGASDARVTRESRRFAAALATYFASDDPSTPTAR